MDEIVFEKLEEEHRYSRLQLIDWWDQKKLSQALVMVVGAGALGNEILKNLALLGIGNILIIDFDMVESSNLSRCVLYRENDAGKSKASIATERLKEINPNINVFYLTADIRYEVGLGVFKAVDLVIAGLDNREARLFINQACYKVGTPWIDGAIEVLAGVARVFIPPQLPCYECTLNELDYKIIAERKSCQFIPFEEQLRGKIPTTPTTSSIIAAVQVQEAVKLLHNRDNPSILKGKGFFYQGQFMDSYLIEYQVKEDCPSHDNYEEIVCLDKRISNTKLSEVLNLAKEHLGKEVIVELEQEIVTKIRCKNCHMEKKIYKSLGRISKEEIICSKCQKIGFIESVHYLSEDMDEEMTFSELGIPPWDIITARCGNKRVHFEFTGDKKDIFKC